MSDSKTAEKSQMSDILTMLYKAFDDVTATIRALDAKASYLIAIVVFLGGSYYGLIKDVYVGDALPKFYYLPLLFLILSAWFYIISLSPYSDLSKKLVADDAIYVKNNFFILTQNQPLQSNDIFKADLTDPETIKKVITIEILKLSHLRDAKIKWIKNATYALHGFMLLASGMMIHAFCVQG